MLASLPADPTKFAGAKMAEIINQALPYIFGLAGFAVLFFIILGGYQYMTSRGEPQAVSNAQKTISHAILGFIIMVTAYFITNLIGVTLDLTKITSIFN
jgi:hypothetical protein